MKKLLFWLIKRNYKIDAEQILQENKSLTEERSALNIYIAKQQQAYHESIGMNQQLREEVERSLEQSRTLEKEKIAQERKMEQQKELIEQSRVAQVVVERENERLAKENNQLKDELKQSILDNKTLSDQIAQLSKKTDSLQNSIRQSEEGKEALQREKERLTQEMESISAKMEENKNELTVHKRILTERDAKISNLTEEMDALARTHAEEQAKNSELSNALQKYVQTVASSNEIIADQKRKLEESQVEAGRMTHKVEELTQQLKDIDNELLDQIDSLKRRNSGLESENKTLKEENRNLKSDNSNSRFTIESLEKSLSDKKRELDELRQRVTAGVEMNAEAAEETKASEYEDTVDTTHEEEVATSADDAEKTNGPTPDDTPISLEEESEISVEEGNHYPGTPQDKGDVTQSRKIECVLDLEENKIIHADAFFSQPESVIFKMRSELVRGIYLKKPRFVCESCGQPVKIAGRKFSRGEARFFSHLRDSDNCIYKTTTGKTKREIEREKYGRCNEGQRHKTLKALIARYLQTTPNVEDVRLESTVHGNHPVLRWRRPDVSARYRGQELVFELQLSTTFVSVIAERDLFYRLNQTHIIWIFNFDEYAEHVDLTNMMTKDIYYNNHLNIFIFDRDAQRKSEELGELVLKCNWIKPDGKWEYENGNTHDALGGRFVKLSDLTFTNAYKPFYYDAEKAYFAAHQEFELKVRDIEEENKKYIRQLDVIWKKELAAKNGNEKEAEKQQLTAPDDERNEIIRMEPLGPNYIKYAQKVGLNWLWGIMNNEAETVCQAKYSQIEIWTEEKFCAVSNNIYSIIDKNGEEIVSGYDYIGPLDSTQRAVVKKDDRDGHIDNNGCVVDSEEIKIDENHTKVCQIGLWGIRRNDGTMLVPCKYDELGSYHQYGGSTYLIGIHNQEIDMLAEGCNLVCPVKVKYVKKNERKMLIFRVGKRECLMNFRQQQKAFKNGKVAYRLTEMYISHVNQERDLIYLSATPILHAGNKVNDSDIEVGKIVEGIICKKNVFGIIVRSYEGEQHLVHCSTFENYTLDDFSEGQSVSIEKIGYDTTHSKHIWRVIRY